MKILTGKDKLIYERLLLITHTSMGFLNQLSNYPEKLGCDYKEVKITRHQLDSMKSDIRSTLEGYNDHNLN